MQQSAFYPGRPWLDTEGKRIQAHAGCLLFENDTYYWYGEDKSLTVPGSGIRHNGVRLYSSVDLYNWQDRGTILAASDDPRSPLHPARILDRPHILYDRKNQRYVLWVKLVGDGDAPRDWRNQYMGVAVAERITGPFRLVRTFHPLGMNTGDFDLFTDPADGKGYFVFDRVHTELVIADLTGDYTDVTGAYSCHFPLEHPPAVREAPALFWRDYRFTLLTSGTTGYYPNPSEGACAKLIHGPWTVLGDLHPSDARHTSFDTQISSVFRHPLCKDLYIALADRWLTDLPENRPDMQARFEAEFTGNEAALATLPSIEDISAVNTSVAEYVWLPIRFQGHTPVIEWADTWRWEDWA